MRSSRYSAQTISRSLRAKKETSLSHWELVKNRNNDRTSSVVMAVERHPVCDAARPPPTNYTGPVCWKGRADVAAASDGQAKLSTGLYRRQYVPMFLSAAKSTVDRDTNVNTTVAHRVELVRVFAPIRSLAQGRPECSRCPVCSCAVLFCANRTRDRGCSKHPVFPAPSDFRGGQTKMQTSDATRRENAKVVSA